MNGSDRSAPVASLTWTFFHHLLQSLNRDICWGKVKRKGRATKTMGPKLTPEGSARVTFNCEREKLTQKSMTPKLQSRNGTGSPKHISTI